MQTSLLVEALIDAFCCLPGIGPKSAQRMSLYLLRRNRIGARNLAKILVEAMDKIGYCVDCRTFTEQKRCAICSNPHRRDSNVICVVENPADVYAIEQTGQFLGRYFVLMGCLSPLDGIGPKEIGIELFSEQLRQEKINEVILAINPTMEGEVTVNYIAEICSQYDVPASRIAHGIPIGGELESVDGTTLSHSFIGRQPIKL